MSHANGENSTDIEKREPDTDQAKEEGRVGSDKVEVLKSSSEPETEIPKIDEPKDIPILETEMERTIQEQQSIQEDVTVDFEEREAPGPSPVQDVIEVLEKKIAELEKELEETKNRMLRIAADFENYKKRSQKDSSENYSAGMNAVIKEMLPVIDNLERALEHCQVGVDDSLFKGIKMVEESFLQKLKKIGVERFSSLGQTFDPSFHEAMMRKESNEHPPMTITGEFQKGYTYKGKLLRPALVIVSVAPESKPESQPPAEAEGESKKEEDALKSEEK